MLRNFGVIFFQAGAQIGKDLFQPGLSFLHRQFESFNRAEALFQVTQRFQPSAGKGLQLAHELLQSRRLGIHL